MRTQYDLEMMQEVGFCSGIENYSAPLDGRGPGETPNTLLDYFPKDFLVVLDESHQSRAPAPRPVRGRPQPQGAAHRARLPAAVGGRQPAAALRGVHREGRPGGLPVGHPRPLRAAGVQPGRRAGRPPHRPRRPRGHRQAHQGPDRRPAGAIEDRVDRGDRVLVTTLTKKMAEDLTEYLLEQGVRVRYLHSEVDTIQRIELLRGLRLGDFDVLVGINLLREGLDLPEVSLVAILDADKEGFLRSETSLDPDHRPGRPQRRGPGGHVRRPGHRLDAAGHQRDQPAPRPAAGLQRRSTASTRRRSARPSPTSSA